MRYLRSYYWANCIADAWRQARRAIWKLSGRAAAFERGFSEGEKHERRRALFAKADTAKPDGKGGA